MRYEQKKKIIKITHLINIKYIAVDFNTNDFCNYNEVAT